MVGGQFVTNATNGVSFYFLSQLRIICVNRRASAVPFFSSVSTGYPLTETKNLRDVQKNRTIATQIVFFTRPVP